MEEKHYYDMQHATEDNEAKAESGLSDLLSVKGEAEPLPVMSEWWLLVCRNEGMNWYPCGDMKRHKIDAEEMKGTWKGYEHYRLIRVVLPT